MTDKTTHVWPPISSTATVPEPDSIMIRVPVDYAAIERKLTIRRINKMLEDKGYAAL